jgi:hypothetical protein
MTELEKIAYVVIMASHKLRHYFEAHRVRVTTNRGLGDLFRNPKASARIAKWAAKLSRYNVTFEPRIGITIITSPIGLKYIYVVCLSFALESHKCTNKIAEYEIVILGLRKLRALG